MQQIFSHIAADAGVLGGQPVIEGTTVPVSLLVSQVAAGKSLDEVARVYRVTVEEVRAALEYAAQRASEPASGVRQDTGSGAQTGAELSPAAAEEARRLGLEVAKISPLGRDLLEIRAQAAAAGERFLSSQEEIDAEIAERRGGVSPYPDVDE